MNTPVYAAGVWERGSGGLALRVGHRRTVIPPALLSLLAGADGIGLSPTAALDILAAEARLRQRIARAATAVVVAEERVRRVREARSVARRFRARRTADIALRTAADEHKRTVAALETSRVLLADLRAIVVAAAPTSGRLAAAVAGWARDPEPPATVTVFADVTGFLDADSRRGTGTDWGRRIDGVELWGRGWRRDGDDDTPTARPDLWQDGPWALGCVRRTGEIYAVRRSPHLTDAVWLLGSAPDTRGSLRSLLDPLTPRMREPNSLLLAADAVGAAVRRAGCVRLGDWRGLDGADLVSRPSAGNRMKVSAPDASAQGACWWSLVRAGTPAGPRP